jgi:plasmid stabilization system protein ParE
MRKKIKVKLTANFEQNLEDIAQFLSAAEAPKAYDALLDELIDTVIPNLERFPDMGRIFFDSQVRSVEADNALTRLQTKLAGNRIHELLFADYLLLYARRDETIYLLSIKHSRQLSFDLALIWGSQGG